MRSSSSRRSFVWIVIVGNAGPLALAMAATSLMHDHIDKRPTSQHHRRRRSWQTNTLMDGAHDWQATAAKAKVTGSQTEGGKGPKSNVGADHLAGKHSAAPATSREQPELTCPRAAADSFAHAYAFYECGCRAATERGPSRDGDELAQPHALAGRFLRSFEHILIIVAAQSEGGG